MRSRGQGPAITRGLVHAVQAAVSGTSSWHWKVRLPLAVTLSLPVNVKVAEVAVVAADGWPVRLVSGGVVSGPGGGGGGGGGAPGPELEDRAAAGWSPSRGVELLLGVLVLDRVADQEAVVAGRVHRLHEAGDVELAPAAAGADRGGAAGRRRLVRPRHAALAPGAGELEGLDRPARLRRAREQPQRGRLDDAALRHRRQVEADERAQVAAALRHHLEDRVGSLVRRRAAGVDPGVGVRGQRRLRRRSSRAGRAWIVQL